MCSRIITIKPLCRSGFLIAISLSIAVAASAEYTIESHLTRKIKSELAAARELKPYDIQVIHRSKGKIIIVGRAGDEETKEKLLEIVRDQEGVLELVDEVTVDPSLVENLSAEDVQRELKSALKGRFTLSVAVTIDTITVTGQVHDRNDIARATKSLQSIAKGRKVINELVIAPSASDAQLLKKIEKAIEKKPLLQKSLRKSPIEITVTDATATLTGTITNHRTIDELLSTVLMVEGIKNIDNKVKVQDSKTILY